MKTEIKLSTLSPEEIKLVFDNSKEKNTIFETSFKSLIYYEWWYVKTTVPNLIKQGQLTELVNTLLVKEGALANAEEAEVHDVIGVVAWALTELKRIQELEATYLTPEPNADLANAGVEELQVFGETNTLDALAGGDITKWEAIKVIPYCDIFDKLRKGLIETKIQKRYTEIMEAKRPRKGK